MFAVTILGNNSALPAYNRHPTSQLVVLNDQLFLVDCGEGTQMQMNLYKIRRGKINHVFISHLHGDHYFGLPGLITSFGLLGRTNDLHLYAPSELKLILDTMFNVSSTSLPFNFYFHALEDSGVLYDGEYSRVECFKVFHRINCWGFLFKEKRSLRKINVDAVKKFNVPVSFFGELKNGADYIIDDKKISNELLTIANKPARMYAYCTDTLYNEELVTYIKNADLLYHESTYLKDQEQKAASRYHSTTVQAAQIANLAGVKKLLLGHFSSSYDNLDEFLTEAQQVFQETQLALEGQTYLV